MLAPIPQEIEHGDIVLPKPIKEVKPIEIPERITPITPDIKRDNISFFGTNVEIALDFNKQFRLSDVNEKSVKRMWEQLSNRTFDTVFDECARIYSDLKLNGWAFYKFCKSVAEKIQGSSCNEANVITTFLLTQMGYDARLVRINGGVYVMTPTNADVANVVYLIVNGKKYYVWDYEENGGASYTYELNYEAATRPLNLDQASNMLISGEETSPRAFTSKINPNVTMNVSVNKSLMEYYRSMPLALDWSFYARQPMSKSLSSQVLPVLRRAIQGKSEQEAANIIIYFVQTAFTYKVDQEWFGKEKYDYKEEPFYDQYCDCEDRAILYSDLVKNLLGLDAVLLHYPNHLSTAVKFNQEVKGDYVIVDGVKYIICEPTFTDGGSIGNCMTQFKKCAPIIHYIYR